MKNINQTPILSIILLIGILVLTSGAQAAPSVDFFASSKSAKGTNPDVRLDPIADSGVGLVCLDAASVTCFLDNDGDTFGSTSTLISADDDCGDPGESLVNTDCDDGDPFVYPGADEIPGDGVDQDCSGSDAGICHFDGDGDTFGVDSTILSDDEDCDDPGESLVNTDCDDGDPFVYPGADEIPGDGVDQDCSGADLFVCFLPLVFR
jgi:hypothetical protein